jgi:hypothetical protein
MIARVVSSLITAIFFTALTILAQSLVKNELVSQYFLLFEGLVVFIITLFINHNLFSTFTFLASNSATINDRYVEIPNYSRAQLALYGAFSVSVSIFIYFWTSKFELSLISICFLGVALLLVNYAELIRLKLKLTLRLNGHIVHSYTFVPLVAAIFASLEILFMKWLPVVTFDKVKLAVYFGFIPLLACATLVSLVDSEFGGPEA